MSTSAMRSAVMDWPAMLASIMPDWMAGQRESQAEETTSSSQP